MQKLMQNLALAPHRRRTAKALPEDHRPDIELQGATLQLLDQ
jgi:hypothetical protein